MMQIRDLPLLLVTIGCIILLGVGMVLGARCASHPDPDPGPGIHVPGLGTIADPTPDSGKPAPQPGRKAIIAGSGYWIAPEPIDPGDSLSVALAVIQSGEHVGVTVSIDSVPVVWQELRLTWPRERFGLYGEAAWIGDRFRPAVGLAWKPAQIWGVEVGPAVSVGLDQPVWGAVSARASRRVWSTVEAGATVGYRIGDDPGLHLGASVGFAF
jgi:hypothetical protein